MVTRRTSPIAGLLYIVSQLLGALIGAALVFAVTAAPYRIGGKRGGGEVGSKPVGGEHLPPDQWWPGGCTVPSEHTSEAQAFAVELFASFLFVFVVFAAYDKTKAERLTPAAPFIVGLTNAAVLLFAVSSQLFGVFFSRFTPSSGSLKTRGRVSHVTSITQWGIALCYRGHVTHDTDESLSLCIMLRAQQCFFSTTVTQPWHSQFCCCSMGSAVQTILQSKWKCTPQSRN